MKGLPDFVQRGFNAQSAGTSRSTSPQRSQRSLPLRVIATYLLLFAGTCSITAWVVCPDGTAGFAARPSDAHHPTPRRGLFSFGRRNRDALLKSEVREPGLPKGFDWKAYVLWNPDVRAAHLRTRDAAIQHYKTHGRDGSRQYKKRPLLVRYSACQGLFNQIYAHMSALILADFLGADVVLPPSVYRTSFSYSQDPKKNKVTWLPTDVGRLINVDALRKQYARKGMRILDTPPFLRFPDCNRPKDAYIHYNDDDLHQLQIIRLPDVYLQSMHIWYIWDKAAAAINERHAQLAQAGLKNDTLLVLDLPCPFMSIMTLTCLEEAEFAATALQFNPEIERLASIVLRRMRRRGARKPNGVHLRLEKDAGEWAKRYGGLAGYLREYTKAFGAAGFSRQHHLYVASGLLSYNATKEMQDLMDFLAPFSKEVHYKERYLKPSQLAGLNPEQMALLDFLVLTRTNMLVGLGSSSFSVYLREYRTLLGHPRSNNIFVDSRCIGTDPLFERCTHFAPLAS